MTDQLSLPETMTFYIADVTWSQY